jgi:D-glycero-alpha-D-manno-heptose-7-phosphate kinase
VAANGGFTVTAAIDSYVYAAVNRTFDDGYRLKYVEAEHAETVSELRHPIMREALRLFDTPAHVEVASLADVSAGTGLGSSGAFTVALCKALAEYSGQYCSRDRAADLASVIELNVLGRPGGRQDQYACAYGGVQGLTFRSSGSVYADSVVADPSIERSLLLFFTGFARNADEILSVQSTEGLDVIARDAWSAKECVESGDIERLGGLFDAHWQAKRRRSSKISNAHIDGLYERGISEGGAFGGKLVGAGGGGFLLFVTDDVERLRSVMVSVGVRELVFGFDHDGCVIL